MTVELVSVHIPKTAGGTFLRVLQAQYGVDAVLYEDLDRITDPLSVYNVDPSRWKAGVPSHDASPARVIHGHFPVCKYWPALRGPRWITWVREPVRRLVSHFFFWRSLSPEHSGHSLHRYMIENDLELEEFAALPLMRDFQSRHFLGDHGLEIFDFVGIHEHFDSDLADLGARMGWKPLDVLPSENRNRQDDYSRQRRSILEAPDLVRRLQELNSGDVAMYREATRLREARRTAGPAS